MAGMRDPQLIPKYTKLGIKEYQKNPVASLKYFLKAYQQLTPDVDVDTTHTVVYNLALTYYTTGSYEKAIALYETLPASHHDGQYERALALFNLGRLEAGAEFYRHRYFRTTHDTTRFPRLLIPFVTERASFTDRRVLVMNEQGFGDELMFFRSISSLAAVAESVTVQVYPELYDVLVDIVPENVTLTTDRNAGELAKSHDVYTALGDVWLEWLRAPQLQLSTKTTLELDPERFHIGFVQSPNQLSKNARDRAVDVKFFKELATIPGVVLHSLQRDEKFSFATNYVLNTFADTLNIINALDLVVTIDTSVAHLALASATPTLIAYTRYVDWRWKNRLYDVELVRGCDLGKKVRSVINITRTSNVIE